MTKLEKLIVQFYKDNKIAFDKKTLKPKKVEK